jgi:hypothetical protein
MDVCFRTLLLNEVIADPPASGTISRNSVRFQLVRPLRWSLRPPQVSYSEALQGVIIGN